MAHRVTWTSRHGTSHQMLIFITMLTWLLLNICQIPHVSPPRVYLACVQAYSPLGKGTREVLEDKTVSEVARRHGRTNAQVFPVMCSASG